MIRRLLANSATSLVIAACGGVAGVLGWRVGRPHVPPAPPASVLSAAARSMQAAPSYAFSGRVTIGVEVLNVAGTFSAPDLLHETLQLVGGPPIERVSLGAVTYQRGPAGWRRVDSAATMADPRAVFQALSGAASVARQGQDYSFVLRTPSVTALVSGGSAATVARGAALVEAGRVQSVTYRSSAGAGTTATFAYTDIGTAAAVTVPALTS
ncbi:MAG TPA: hypothetical protein VMU14_22115 [Acidimicrobiales bacterium]|nr:hypothetical protein [Acidimicrobiales bacterium]